MQEERLVVIELVECNSIAAADGRKILELLSEENNALTDPQLKKLRMHTLQWLSSREITSAQTLALISIFHKVVGIMPGGELSVKALAEISVLMQMKDARSIESRVLVILAEKILHQNQQDPTGVKHAERIGILNMAQTLKITCTTAMELLDALMNPQDMPADQITVKERGRSTSRAVESDSQIRHRITQEMHRFRPEALLRKDRENTSSFLQQGDLRQSIRSEVDHALQTGRISQARNSTTVPLQRSEATKPPNLDQSRLSILADQLHDALRQLEIRCQALEQEWASINRTPLKGSTDAVLHRIRSQLATARTQMAAVIESRSLLEQHLTMEHPDEARYFNELISYAVSSLNKSDQQLRNLELGVIELESIQKPEII